MSTQKQIIIGSMTITCLIIGNLLGSKLASAVGGHDICDDADVVSISPQSGSSASYTATNPDKIISGVCVKAGSDQQDDGHVLYTSNGTFDSCYTISGLGTKTVTVTKIGSGPNCKDISHLDVYKDDGETTPTPTPTDSPSPTPTDNPTPTPTDQPTPTPTDNPEVTPTPTDQPTPTPTDRPSCDGICVIGTPTPTPTDNPEVTPTPTDQPSATPTPTNTPDNNDDSGSSESSDGGQDIGGRVLGATTDTGYADTGVFTEVVSKVGAALTSIGALGSISTSKKAKKSKKK